MFWGLILKANRKYSQTTSKSFHISQAALDSTSSQGGATQIFLSYEEQKFLICTLHKDRCEQVSLDLNFAEGDEISFQSQGSGNVTLSGYLIEQDPMSFMGDDEEEEEESEVEAEDEHVELQKKAKKKGKAAAAVEEDDDDDDDSDFNVEAALTQKIKERDGDEDEDDDEDEDEDEDEEEDDEDNEGQEEVESEEEDFPQPKAKQAKLEKPHKQQNGIAKENEQKSQKDKKNKKEKKEQKQQQPKQSGEKVLSGGVKIEDIRVGNGPEAKSGKRTTVYYEGRLKSNNKVFDSLKQGAGFKFGLGRGEVIKGWDIGVAGMKVGGKRRITCPPHMAYGARGSPPTIPPNSSLVFEVELKGVN